MAKVINSSEFEGNVLNSSETVLVDFFATWCGPCKMIAPVLEELSEEMKGKVEMFKVDVDRSAELAQKYGIQGVPTLMIFKDGKSVDRIVGFQPKEILKSRLQQY
ncbi:thioredoxin [Clostridium kluyveri]|uniref:Thioredoxin n=3 Tax=Clostridium kluyveri TaxID=1534 RepID=A5MZU9_CLOK5|nr:thioredoxin [Clostridium kluyveri]APM39649.1 thioredoxin [Clostridium kluyveri]EDK34395.1 Hypothetical protein CKL_2383 [Clostridium kluyveri DSM 555]UZQ50195.1 thioredoxin [Clostridium kluyveri]